MNIERNIKELLKDKEELEEAISYYERDNYNLPLKVRKINRDIVLKLADELDRVNEQIKINMAFFHLLYG